MYLFPWKSFLSMFIIFHIKIYNCDSLMMYFIYLKYLFLFHLFNLISYFFILFFFYMFCLLFWLLFSLLQNLRPADTYGEMKSEQPASYLFCLANNDCLNHKYMEILESGNESLSHDISPSFYIVHWWITFFDPWLSLNYCEYPHCLKDVDSYVKKNQEAKKCM